MCKIIQIIVCYYNENEIYEFVDALFEQKMTPEKIIIVNNGSNNEETLFKIKKKYNLKVEIQNIGKNLGYWGAFQHALKYTHDKYDYYILSNSDINFLSNDFYLKLCSSNFSSKKNIGIIAPTIYSQNLKNNLNPYLVSKISLRNIKKLKFIYSNKYFALFYNFLHFLKNNIKISKKIKYGSIDNENRIYAPHGSFMIFTNNFISKNNYLYDAFLFGEELYVGEVCSKLQLDVIYYPDIEIIHNEHTTTGLFQSGLLLEYKYESLVFLYKFLKENK
jgi:GT2 family glycosyltransferase